MEQCLGIGEADPRKVGVRDDRAEAQLAGVPLVEPPLEHLPQVGDRFAVGADDIVLVDLEVEQLDERQVVVVSSTVGTPRHPCCSEDRDREER